MTLPPWLDTSLFVLKVLGVSLALSVVFKTIAPSLGIPATDGVSLAIVLAPALILGSVLIWRLRRPPHAKSGRD